MEKYKSKRQVEKRKNKDYTPDSFSYTRLFQLWKLEHPYSQIKYKDMVAVYKVIDDITLEECLKGVRVSMPRNIGTLYVSLQKDAKFYYDNINDIYRRRVNGKATVLKKQELLVKGDTTTNPTVYFENTWFLSWKLRAAKRYDSDRKRILPEIMFYKYAPCVKWRNRLKEVYNSLTLEEAIKIFGVTQAKK